MSGVVGGASVLDTDDIDLENSKLSDLFDKGWSIEQELEKSASETSESFLLNRKKAIEILQKCEYMLDELHLFSENESLDEVSTGELRYFINYALLGWLFTKVSSTNHEIRSTALNQARNYFINYLNLTRNYEFHKYDLSKLAQNGQNSLEAKLNSNSEQSRQAAFDANLISMAYDRNEKIRRYKEQKELESQLETIKSMMKSNQKVDEEHRRKFYISYIKYWINRSIDDLKMTDDELNILKSMEARKKETGLADSKLNKPIQAENAAPKKPFIITKDALQAKVFGAGYPSLPVYSVEQFYDHLAQEGHMPKANDPNENYAPVKIGGGVTESQKQKDKEDKDKLEDAHDEEELRKQREWDEFKDDNKRGSGNRFNRS